MRMRFLLSLDGLEERPKIAVAETLVSTALDELVKEGAGSLVAVEARRFAQEDLEHVLVILAVDEDLEILEVGKVVGDVVDAELGQAFRKKTIVILVGRQERQTSLAELANGGHDVRQSQREVLDAGAGVVVA